MSEDGRHLAAPPNRRGEHVLIGIGAVTLAAAVVCWLADSSAGAGFFLLAATSCLGVPVVRMKNDPSAWKIPVGDTERRALLIVLTVLVGVLALTALFQIASSVN